MMAQSIVAQKCQKPQKLKDNTVYKRKHIAIVIYIVGALSSSIYFQQIDTPGSPTNFPTSLEKVW